MTRVAPHLFASVLVALVLWPLTWPDGRDDFPLSPYPMFARGRGTPVLTVSHVLGVGRDGVRSPVAPELVASYSALQAMASVQSAVASGSARPFCREIAARVSSSVPADLRPISLEVATSSYDVVAYFDGDTRARDRRVHARCPVSP